jgi:hypothetical protein
MPNHVGQVLVQVSAERDIEHLSAAANAEHRQASLDRAGQQRELPRVAIAARLVGFRMRLLTVYRRVDIFAAGDDQAVEPVEHAVCDRVVHRLRRQQHRDAAGASYAVEVNVRQQSGVYIPDARLGPFEIGR